jgi:hypothetical protein
MFIISFVVFMLSADKFTYELEKSAIGWSLLSKIKSVTVKESGEVRVEGDLRYDRGGWPILSRVLPDEVVLHGFGGPFSLTNHSNMQISGVPESIVLEERWCFASAPGWFKKHLISDGDSIPFTYSTFGILDHEKVRLLPDAAIDQLIASLRLRFECEVVFVPLLTRYVSKISAAELSDLTWDSGSNVKTPWSITDP